MIKPRITSNNRGHIHLILPLLAVALVAVIGGYVYMQASRAASITNADYLQSGITNKCLDDYRDGKTEGTKADSYVCNKTAAQQWTLNSEANGTVMIENANGSCLDNWQAKKTSGNPIKLYNCNPKDGAQLWTTTGTILKNPMTGMCIEDPNSSTTNGTALELYACNGGKDQTWAATKVPTGSTPAPTPTPTPNPTPTPTGGGAITAGDSKANCIALKGGTDGEVSLTNLAATEKATGLTYKCLETFANPVDNWTDWEAPWQFTNDPSKTTSGSWENWLATGHQMILGVDLIPQSAPGSSNGTSSTPSEWEADCAAGEYNGYATQLAKNLVSYGASGITIRLGIEANGSWEADYVGTTTTEMSNWAKCYDNEVSSMRSVAGTSFLFVWNPNICTLDLPLSDWYPGNKYVNIIGADAYDADCHDSSTVAKEGWQAYYTDSSSYPGAGFPSLSNIEAFAKANGKPMSFPEWGVTSTDDGTYVTDMGQMFNSDDFSFESYFDVGDDGIPQLGSSIPNATAAYTKEFK
jgi:uncharacterized protein (UPF0333 family)